MMWVWVIGAVVVGFIILLSSSMKCRLTLIRRHADDEIVFDIHAMYGLVKKRLAIPVLKLSHMLDALEVTSEVVNKSSHQLEKGIKQKITLDKIKLAYTNFQELLEHCFQFNKWLLDTLRHVRCTKLYWKTNVGLGDAAETAMATGIVWGLKSSLLGFLFQFIQLKTRPQLLVVPQYNEYAFASEIICLAKVRLFYILVAGIRLLFRILRVKNGLKTWQRVLFKAT
jgi:hypothetical protein